MLICPIKYDIFKEEMGIINDNIQHFYHSMPKPGNNLHFQLWKIDFDEYCKIISEWRRKWRRWIILYEYKRKIRHDRFNEIERRRKEMRLKRRGRFRIN